MSSKSKIEQDFNYPVNYECEYVMPSKYYLNAKLSHIIKKERLIIDKPVGIDKNGVFELPESKDEENELQSES